MSTKEEQNKQSGAPIEAPSEPEARSDEARPDEESLEQEVERLKRELEEARAAAEDRYLRQLAEIENVRKRVLREKAEALRYAAEPLIRDLLPVIDDLERAVEHAERGGNGQPIVEGVRLVLKSALDALARHGVTRIDAVGQRFDPAVHEAVAQAEDETVPPGHVVEQYRPGYRLHERLIRPAQVSVAAGGAAKADGGSEGEVASGGNDA